MQNTIALLGLAAVAYAAPQAALAPTESAPAGCSSSYSGTFEIQAVNTTILKRSVEKRAACGGEGTLVISLDNGALKDAKGRVGEIVANYQFQFDPEPQTGAIYTSGFSVCNNGSLALGGSAVFYQCLSGGFYNLYDRSHAEQCEPILLNVIPCGSSDPAAVGQSTDGQPTGTAVGQLTDGQPTATTAVAISQITDGQIQGGTPVPISQITDGQVQVVTAVPISQIGDGQIQAPTATASGVVSQISDGQVQATTAASGVVSQISDGQIQATSAVSGVISQISDGQIQATGASNYTAPSASSTPIQANSGNGLQIGSQLAAIVLGAVAVALL